MPQQPNKDHIRYTWGKTRKNRYKASGWFKYAQVIGPLLPIPVGCYLLYKALTSLQRSPPPNMRDPKDVLKSKLYQEPVYQRISFAPSTFMKNATPRGTPGDGSAGRS